VNKERGKNEPMAWENVVDVWEKIEIFPFCGPMREQVLIVVLCVFATGKGKEN